MARVEQQSVCHRELLTELTESLGNLDVSESAFQSSLNPRSPSNLTRHRQAETLCQITFYYTITSNRVSLNRRFPWTPNK